MFSKSWIQFSVDGWGCVSSLLFTWGQTMGEAMKIMVTSFKRSHACTATLSALSPAAGHHRPMPPPETPGHSQASLGQSLVGPPILSPGSWYTRGSVCAHQDFVSQSCVSSHGSVVGLMVTSSNRGSTALRAPAPAAIHCWPEPPQETRTVLSQSLWGLWNLRYWLKNILS